MSFSFEITGMKVEVLEKLPDTVFTGNAPQSVKDFIALSVEPFAPEQRLYVKAYGHVYDGQSYNVSSATIEVKPA